MNRWLSWLRRRWLLVLLTIGFLVLLFLQLGDIEKLGATLLQGQWQWLLAAILLQVVYFLLYAEQYHVGFAIMEVSIPWRELVPIVFASIFLQAIVPSGGVSSLAVFIDDAARRGQSPARAAEGALLVLIADLATMTPVILYGLAYLALRDVLPAYELTIAALGTAFYLLFTAGLGGVLLLGRWLPEQLRSIFRWTQDNVNWLASLIRRPPVLPPEWAEREAREDIEAARGIFRRPRWLEGALGIAFALHVVNLATLWVVSLAYQQPLSFGALAAAFSMNVVFSVVNVIPHGLGAAEVIMAVVLTALGTPAVDAVAISIVFRGLNVWLPLFVGFLFLRQVQAFGGQKRS